MALAVSPQSLQAADTLNRALVSELHDLHNYHEQFSKMREFQSLSIRRTSNLASRRHSASYTLDESGLEPSQIIEMLNGCDSNTILETNLGEIDDMRILTKFAISKDLASALVTAVSNHEQFQKDALLKILDWIALLFAAAPENVQHVYSDDGLFYTVLDLLETSISPNLLAMMCQCASADVYARDMMTCLGIHTRLLEIAAQSEDPVLCECCLTCVLVIFRNDGEMEATTVTECVDGLFSLLERNQKLVLECFIEMVKQYYSVIPSLFNQGLYDIALRHVVERTEFTKLSLCLLGNLRRSDPKFISALLDKGLFPCLMEMVARQEHLADVYWVLWNIVEAVPTLLIRQIDASFITQTLRICDGCGFDVKKECAFFLATLIILLEVKDIKSFVCIPVMELLSEIMNCGVSCIEGRCIDALGKMLLAVAQSFIPATDLLAMIEECKIRDSLTELTESEDSAVAEHAAWLAYQLESWTN